MFRRYPRYPRLTYFTVWSVAMSVFILGRMAYLEMTGRSMLVVTGGTQAIVPTPAWSSRVAWGESTFYGWMVGGVVTGLLLNAIAVLRWRGLGRVDGSEDEDDD